MTEIFNPWTKTVGGFDVRPSGPAGAEQRALVLGSATRRRPVDQAGLAGHPGGHAAGEGLRPIDGPRLRAYPVTTSTQPVPGVLPACRQPLNQLVTS